MLKFIKYIDIIGPPITLKVKNSDTLKTILGGFASLLLYIISIAAFFGFGNNIYYKLNPQVVYSKNSNNESGIKVITDSNMLLAIYDQQTNLPIPNFEKRFILYYDYNSHYGNGTAVEFNGIPLEKCKKDTITKWQGNFFVDPINYYCFPINSQNELFGILNRGSFGGMRLQLDFCQNNTDLTQGPLVTDCIDRELTRTLLTSKRIQMHYIIEDSLINTLNSTNPMSVVSYQGVLNTNTYTWTRLNILFKQIILEIDEGFFIKNIQTSSYEALDTISPESIYSPESNTIFSLMIGTSQWLEIYKIKYIKIQDIFAMMGGFINASLIILKYVIKYTSLTDTVDLFNSIYKFIGYDDIDTPTKINMKEVKYNYTSIMKNNINNISSFSNFSRVIPERQFNPISKTIRKKKIKNYSLNMNSFLTSFRVCFSKKIVYKKQFEVYYQIEKKMNKVASFENLIKLTKFIKFIKNVFIEDYQKEIIKICPTISTEKKTNLKIEELTKILEDNIRLCKNKIDLRLHEYVKMELTD